MDIIIQKFGGTSVSSLERRKLTVGKICENLRNGMKSVVVVSAMGRKGEPYATDTLLSLLSDEYKKNNLLSIDLLISCGEIISTVVLCDELSKQGIDAVPLSGGQAGIITDENFNNASVINVKTERIIRLLENGKVPVIAGFQGESQSGHITTLGRGGSDVTAAILGKALKANSIEIYTDVDGIMTADPRIVKNASLIKEISYSEVFQFADQGAKVIHPRAVEIAQKANIPLIIRNTMSCCNGTIISSTAENNTNLFTGITCMNGRVQITVKKKINNHNKNYVKLLNVLAENNISIDLINIFLEESIFTIDEKDSTKLHDLMKNLELEYDEIINCSKISIIGSRIRGIPGVMASIMDILTNSGIEVLQTADSHTTIWCLVKTENVDSAVIALHERFNLS